jgi:hypothetical protein
MEINKKQQNNNNIPSSWINEFFGNHWSYNKIDPTQHTFFLKIWSYTLPFMAEAHGFKIMFVCCVFISTLASDKCDIKHCGENQGEICFALTCFMHYMHIF